MYYESLLVKIFNPIYGEGLNAGYIILEVSLFISCFMIFLFLGYYHKLLYGIFLTGISIILWVLGVVLGFNIFIRLVIQCFVFIFCAFLLEKHERPVVRSRPRRLPRPLPQYAKGLTLQSINSFLKLFAEGEKKTWKWITTPVFTEAYDFSEGRAIIKKDNLFGYIDRKGTISIEPQFIKAFSFSEGLAPVETDGFEYGYIDKNGSMVFSTELRCEFPFSDGLARVNVDGKYGYIDKTGKTIISPCLDEAYDFSEGLACVARKKWYSYITMNGKLLSKQKFVYAESFSNGIALVKDQTTFYFIDKKGNIAINPELHFDNIWSYVNGFAEVELKGKKGFIDNTGALIVKPKYDTVRSFSEGFAAVDTIKKDGNFDVHYWGFINDKGKVVIEQQFEDAHFFSMGLAPVRIKEKWGYIDTSGKIVIKPDYNKAFPFSRSMGRVCADFQWGYIDKYGAYVILPRFSYLGDFVEGLARASMGVTPNSLVTHWSYIQRLYQNA
ncbi:WG repeat-containing protein [Candidatus Latescibacterota bacterium]